MKFYHFFFTTLFAISFGVACNNNSNNTDYSKEASLNTLVDSASYVIGFQSGKRLSSQGFEDVRLEEFFSGFVAGVQGNDSQIAEEEVQALFTRFNTYLIDKMKTDNQLEAESFFAENRNVEGVQETESGLQYKVITMADGASPSPQDTVVVMYEGRAIDGTIFDSTYELGEPASFLLGEVIQGLIEGIQLMQIGSTYELYIPSHLAYGEFGGPAGRIQPNQALIFKIELLDIR